MAREQEQTKMKRRAPEPRLGAKPAIPAEGAAAEAGTEAQDQPLLDLNDQAVRKMIAKAKTRGYVTYDELNKVMPSEQVSSEQIEDTMSMLSEMGINVVETEEQEEAEAEAEVPAIREDGSVTAKPEAEALDRTDDPVRMYLREMGSVELLSREGEIAIAKRIEAGRETMIGGLCESPLTFRAITIWRDELNEGRILLRDVIDLDATYGQGPDGVPQPAAPGAVPGAVAPVVPGAAPSPASAPAPAVAADPKEEGDGPEMPEGE